MPFDNKELSEDQRIMLRARELLEKEGWIQGDSHTKYGRCLGNALYVATREAAGWSLEKASEALRDACMAEVVHRNSLHGSVSTSIVFYNDQIANSREDAYAFLDAVLARL